MHAAAAVVLQIIIAMLNISRSVWLFTIGICYLLHVISISFCSTFPVLVLYSGFATAEKNFREFIVSARRRRRLKLASKAKESQKSSGDCQIITKEQFSPSKTTCATTPSSSSSSSNASSASSSSSSSSVSNSSNPAVTKANNGALSAQNTKSGGDIAKGVRPKLRLRMKLLKFFENRRPPYYGTFRKKAVRVNGRRAFAKGVFWFWFSRAGIGMVLSFARFLLPVFSQLWCISPIKSRSRCGAL